MSYFLSTAPLKVGEIAELAGDEARHILLSRRIKIGEIIEIQDPSKKRFHAEVIDVSKQALSIKVLEEIETPKESPLKLTIFQALIKEQPLDYIIQKITELGVDKLALFHSQNSIERFKDINKKIERWRKVAEEAAKQSGRIRGIDIIYLEDKEKLEVEISKREVVLLLDPSSNQTITDPQKSWEPTWTSNIQVNLDVGRPSTPNAWIIGILVGPEGGFTTNELDEFSKMKNITPISLGPRILRADTAAIASSAITQSLWGDM